MMSDDNADPPWGISIFPAQPRAFREAPSPESEQTDATPDVKYQIPIKLAAGNRTLIRFVVFPHLGRRGKSEVEFPRSRALIRRRMPQLTRRYKPRQRPSARLENGVKSRNRAMGWEVNVEVDERTGWGPVCRKQAIQVAMGRRTSRISAACNLEVEVEVEIIEIAARRRSLPISVELKRADAASVHSHINYVSQITGAGRGEARKTHDPWELRHSMETGIPWEVAAAYAYPRRSGLRDIRLHNGAGTLCEVSRPSACFGYLACESVMLWCAHDHGQGSKHADVKWTEAEIHPDTLPAEVRSLLLLWVNGGGTSNLIPGSDVRQNEVGSRREIRCQWDPGDWRPEVAV
ncbi:hypothetical protein DFH09DRAFT_1285540 [Mycena vulgaris]|nr:hypothetical protein DFH09DRAFT_1285540 [Mycena vulgaris]